MNKFFIFLYLALVFISTASFGEPIEENSGPILKVRGGISPLLDTDLKDAEEALQLSLNKLAAGDDFKLKLVKIHSASKQVVSGSKYKIKADFLDVDEKTKTCDVTIWSQPWLENGIEVTFECEGEDKIVKKHSA